MIESENNRKGKLLAKKASHLVSPMLDEVDVWSPHLTGLTQPKQIILVGSSEI